MKNNIRIADSIADLKSFLESTKEKSDFELSNIKLSQQSDWVLRKGVLSHTSNGFFHVTGLLDVQNNREHLVLFQPQSALTGLALYRDVHSAYVLLQARIEPGNVNICQYGPTIQSTKANYLRFHGGRNTSYLELFDGFHPNANPLSRSHQSDLGRRYYLKDKIHSYVELDQLIPTDENFIWVPLKVLFESVRCDNFLNTDLRSLISCFDWDLYLHAEQYHKGTIALNECHGYEYSGNGIGYSDYRLVPLDQLTGWTVTDEGVKRAQESGIWVDMFKVSCSIREKQVWTQPLMCCETRGLNTLIYRRKNEQFEFLLTTDSEFGISGGFTYLPSNLQYPGERLLREHILTDSMKPEISLFQSEEGGRFYRNEHKYQIIEWMNGQSIKENQKWVSVGQLKHILKSSNKASLQLRCIVSLVIDKLNPLTSSC